MGLANRSCPNCRSRRFAAREPGCEITRQIGLRSDFILRHFDYHPEPAELMDLTRFMHGGPGRLVACAVCGLVVREEDEQPDYARDVYDRDLLAHLYPRYVQAFREKECQYRGLLPARAEVIELGSHLGAFLEVAEEWDWRPTGLDIGEYTGAFSRAKGLRVLPQTIEDARVCSHAADGLFIWNCFEQIDAPGSTLRQAHRLLKPHGLLVVRTPNFQFYERWRRGIVEGSARALQELAYNNLLGFPYLTGYSPRTLSGLLRSHGFEPVAGFDSALLTVPFPELPRTVGRAAEAHRRFAEGRGRQPEGLSGPWIEIACRRAANS
ncbi:MAG TPA: methyltransferase domain-containing protein [Bryobacteraceae bacterium]|nr:methyltransferase domain-containing protein [Bryobacteraceae bacterium]